MTKRVDVTVSAIILYMENMSIKRKKTTSRILYVSKMLSHKFRILFINAS